MNILSYEKSKTYVGTVKMASLERFLENEVEKLRYEDKENVIDRIFSRSQIIIVIFTRINL